MTYNNFGVVPSDIVNFYHGSELTDYTTNSLTGTQVIQSELDYSEEKVLEAISIAFSNILQNGIPYVYVENGMNLGMTGVALSDLHSSFKVDETNNIIPICSNNICSTSLSNLYDETTSTISVSGGIVTITNVDANKDYFAKLNFTSVVVFGSLKRLIRDMTACRLGSQLYSRGSEDEWVSVKRACTDSAEMMKKIEEDIYWMPFELKKLRYYPGTSPIKIKNGISTLKVTRS